MHRKIQFNFLTITIFETLTFQLKLETIWRPLMAMVIMLMLKRIIVGQSPKGIRAIWWL